MPILLKFHHRWVRIARVFAKVRQHRNNVVVSRFSITASRKAILRHWGRSAEIFPKLRCHWPSPCLHHEFRDIPYRLHFNNFTTFDTKIFMITHVSEMACRRDIKKGRCKCTHIISHATNPVLTFGSGSREDDHIASFQITHSFMQRRKCSLH